MFNTEGSLEYKN